MPLDRNVYEAVYLAVTKANQPDNVGKRIMKCLEYLSEARSISNSDDIKDYLATILEAIQINEYLEEDEELE